MSRSIAKLTTACTNCRRAKKRCSGIVPCDSCSAREVNCIIRPESDRRKHRKGQMFATSAPFSSHEGLGLSVPDPAVSDRIAKAAEELPGSLIFQLQISDDGEFEYRGPPTSIIGDSSPFSHDLDTGRGPPDSVVSDDLIDQYEDEDLAGLPSLDEMNLQLDVFLEWQNMSMVILHRSTLRELVASCTPGLVEPRHQLLARCVLALTYHMQFVTDEQRSWQRKRSEAMFRAAKEALFEIATTKPCVEVVQAACLLACRQFSCGHDNEAWVIHGIGATVAIAIGLHVGRDLEKWVASGHLSAEAAEVRVLAYWAHVLIDRYLTLSLGRSSLLQISSYNTPDVQLRLPKTSFHRAYRANQGILDVDSQGYEDSVSNTLHYSVLLWRIGDRSLRIIYQWSNATTLNKGPAYIARTCRDLVRVVQRQDAAFARWVEQLPQALRVSEAGPLPHLLVLHMACNNLRIHIYRPLLCFISQETVCKPIRDSKQLGQLRADSPMVAAACTQFALQITSLADTFRKHYSLRCSPFMLAHYLLTASTIHVLDAERAMEDEDDFALGQANEALETCFNILHDMGATWKVAYKAIAVINRLRTYRENTQASSKASAGDSYDRADGGGADDETSHEAQDRVGDQYDMGEPSSFLMEGLDDFEEMEMPQHWSESTSSYRFGGITPFFRLGSLEMGPE